MKIKIDAIIKKLKKQDPSLADLFKRHKKFDFTPQLERSPYHSLVRAIAHQQLHGKAAETILNRMIQLFPGKEFPTPEDLVSLTHDQFRLCGFSNNKAKAIMDIAHRAATGRLPNEKKIHQMSNDEIIETLTDIYGVGRWTVEMLLIFQLGRLDIFPVDDFGVRRGYQIWKKKRKMPDAKSLKNADKLWAPYQSIVALYLWREADLAKIKTPS
ncbi:MAG: DNA-3-methyladenine glycosylase 2 family protein [Bdellovibrionota bacterium]